MESIQSGGPLRGRGKIGLTFAEKRSELLKCGSPGKRLRESCAQRQAARRDPIPRWVWYAENASIEVADLISRSGGFTTDSGSRMLTSEAQLQATRPISWCALVHGGRDLERLLVDAFFG